MGKLTNILKYKKAINIKDAKGMSAKDEQGNPILVYMRVIGDYELEESQKKARLASALLRAKLVDDKSEEYIINVGVFDTADEETAKGVIIQGQAASWSSEAYSEVVIPDLPKIEEVARDPDAPTLEELELLDKKIEETNTAYREQITKYIEDRLEALQGELSLLTLDQLREKAKDNMIIILAIEAYLNRLRDEKVWRSVYQDEGHTLPEFKDIDEFNNLDIRIKDQLREEYEKLEQGLDEVKN